ncbi:hypothetical protein VPH35_056545 [Triticum aestivum]
MYTSMAICSSGTSKRPTCSWWRGRCLLSPPIHAQVQPGIIGFMTLGGSIILMLTTIIFFDEDSVVVCGMCSTRNSSLLESFHLYIPKQGGRRSRLIDEGNT